MKLQIQTQIQIKSALLSFFGAVQIVAFVPS
jgi:hypothetical protein